MHRDPFAANRRDNVQFKSIKEAVNGDKGYCGLLGGAQSPRNCVSKFNKHLFIKKEQMRHLLLFILVFAGLYHV